MTEIGDNTSDYTVTLPGRENEPIHLAWGAATDTGRRRAANEDSFVVRPPLFAVADGMGGHSAGDLASAAVVERLAELSGEEFVSATDIERQLVAATEDIETVEGELGVGTTVTGAALTLHDDNPYFAIFNIGDSRVYRFERNELSQVTVDHSVVQELVDAGALTREEAEQHPDSNIITRAVGFNAEPMPDYWMVPIRTGVRLLICSDGLTKEVGDERIRLHLAAGLTPLATADALVDAALAAGGRDNVTTVVIDVLEAPSFTQNETADLDDTEPKLTR